LGALWPVLPGSTNTRKRESAAKGFFIGEIMSKETMKKFKYFGRSYDDAQTLIDRVREDLAGIGLEVVDYGMTVINNNQVVQDPIYGTTYIQAGRDELAFNLKCFVRPAIFDAIDFCGYCKIDALYYSANLVQLRMGFGCYKGQPFERVAEFLMQNNHLWVERKGYALKVAYLKNEVCQLSPPIDERIEAERDLFTEAD
jgi:hypothetical protein